jgi:regulation of enolase protein 1 (concanavalin A-like superfamily)/uridine kinase
MQQKQLIIGISGIKFSGKTTIADKLTEYFSKRAVSIQYLTLSKQENLLNEALKDKNPSKYYYENMCDSECVQEDIANSEAQIILVEGMLLYKNTSDIPFDVKIWVDCTFTTSIIRAKEKEKELVSDLYFWLMRQHFSIDDPKSKADFIFVNDSILEKDPEVYIDSRNPDSLNRFKWLNEPGKWQISNGVIEIEPDSPTDFWQRTHYGFRNDNAHMMYIETEKDFEMSCHVRFNPVHQFDQCGLVVRIDEDNWLKTSIEYELGNPPKLGAVVTNLGYSDWSTEELDFNAVEIDFRIIREGYDYKIEYRFEERWHQMRICHLHNKEKNVKCGLYCCSPIAKGYSVTFEEISIIEKFF